MTPPGAFGTPVRPVEVLDLLLPALPARRRSYFASGRMSSYYSGEVLAPIGGETLPG